MGIKIKKPVEEHKQKAMLARKEFSGKITFLFLGIEKSHIYGNMILISNMFMVMNMITVMNRIGNRIMIRKIEKIRNRNTIRSQTQIMKLMQFSFSLVSQV